MTLIIPKKMYHATSEENAFKILKEGIKPSEWEHVIYLTEYEEDAAKFGGFYATSRPKNYKEIMKQLSVFESLSPEEIAEGKFEAVEPIHQTCFIVFEIDTTDLSPGKFHLSDDHSNSFWQLKGNAYMYSRGRIPTSMITRAEQYDL